MYRLIDKRLYLTSSMDKIYKAMSDKNRRRILELLKSHDMSVSELLKYFEITQASLSHHLEILRHANLVIDERRGQFVYYSLNVSVFEEFVKGLLDMVESKKE